MTNFQKYFGAKWGYKVNPSAKSRAGQGCHYLKSIFTVNLLWSVVLLSVLKIDSWSGYTHSTWESKLVSPNRAGTQQVWLRTWVFKASARCLVGSFFFCFFFTAPMHKCSSPLPQPTFRAATSSSLPRLVNKSHLETDTFGNITLICAACLFGTIKVAVKIIYENMTWKRRVQNDSF